MLNVLIPPVHDRLTGGTLYNRQILARLTGTAITLYQDDRSADRAAWPAGLWLVDSLCLHSGAAHLARQPEAAGILIAHHLNLLDPRHRDSGRAVREREALGHYRAVISTSRYAESEFAAHGFGGEVAMIPPGLDPLYREPVLPRPPRTPTMVTVANLFPDKGYLDLLRHLEELRNPDWSWEIIGDTTLDAEFADRFRQELDRSPLRGRIFVRGPQPPETVAATLDSGDIFVFPSRFETCGMAIMEAMARGLPVVAFRVGGLPSLLPDESREFLAGAGDVASFIASLRMFLTDPPKRQAIGDANCRASAAFPDWEVSAAAMDGLIRRVSVHATTTLPATC
ncbi:MAG TPA: glycosyltransferase family 4 protein [Bryobacteraceae bacterium]